MSLTRQIASRVISEDADTNSKYSNYFAGLELELLLIPGIELELESFLLKNINVQYNVGFNTIQTVEQNREI